MSKLKKLIESIAANEGLLKNANSILAINETIDELNNGNLRVAEPTETGEWKVNEWVKQAILLYFKISQNGTIRAGDIEFFDKIPLKQKLSELKVRVVPLGIARYGSYLAPGVILMPGYVNIGAYVDSGTMIDTFATVGSCAQIGKNVHLSGGVGIGGVLEPIQATPVIIEDGAFIGSRCIVVEGVRICRESVLGAGLILTSSTKIFDIKTGKVYTGIVPERSVVIPGTQVKLCESGEYGFPCALIVGQRKASTNLKTSLNDALREHNVAV